jgi:predicted Zn-ribbon and HTH transcriptional regulator
MFRKGLINMLLDNPHSLVEIAKALDVPPKDVEDDLHHLQKSMKRSGYKLVIQPAECRKCGFKFKKDKLHKPGKCPQCHETWIQEPLIEVVEHKH